MESLWRWDAAAPAGRSLGGDLTVDAAVIGGGMAGVLTARALAGAGLHAVILEARTLGSGQTGNTTAKITAQHGLIYTRLIRQLGESRARLYARANQEAVEEYRRLARSGIRCDFMDCPAYLYSRSRELPLVREDAACRALGLETAFTVTTTLPFPVKGAVRMERQAMLHPLKFLYGAAQGLEVYEHTPVLTAEEDRLTTPRGRVTARYVVFACHYPFVNFPGLYFARMHQERSYVAAVSGAPQLDGIYYGVDPGGLSFRNAGAYLLVGGGGHPTGKGAERSPYDMLEDQAKAFWPQTVPAARWSAQDCVTLDGLPYIGVFSPSRPHWYVATGFQKWGMTASMVAADLISAQITGQEHPLSSVLSPRRFSWTAARSLAGESGRAAKGLLRGWLWRPGMSLDQLPAGQGAVVTWHGKKVAAYREPDGQVHLTSPRCAHLGCQLNWNPEEHTWDCPCHGSRFDCDGNLIDNPAQTGL